MPVQWRGPSRRPNSLSFLSVIHSRWITTLEGPADYAYLALHWQEAHNQSTPCLGEGECRLCPGNVKVHAYTVALAWDGTGKKWVACIADLGHQESTLVQTDLRGQAALIAREKPGDRRSNLVLSKARPLTATEQPENTTPIDVRPHLMRRYGLFHEADYFAAQPYVEQQRLPFPGTEGERGEAS
jgi:hypothetical protein